MNKLLVQTQVQVAKLCPWWTGRRHFKYAELFSGNRRDTVAFDPGSVCLASTSMMIIGKPARRSFEWVRILKRFATATHSVFNRPLATISRSGVIAFPDVHRLQLCRVYFTIMVRSRYGRVPMRLVLVPLILSLIGCQAPGLPYRNVPSRSSLTSATVSSRLPDLAATSSAHGLLFWLYINQSFGALKITSNRISQPFGEQGGQGLAVDRRQNVYETYFGYGVPGVVVLDKNLELARTLDLPNFQPYAVAVDKKEQIYVGGYDLTARRFSIEVFSKSASGGDAPIRTIAGKRTQETGLTALAVDDSGYVYAVNSSFEGGEADNICIFAPGAKGNRAPVRVVSGDETGIVVPLDVALGADGNIYLANQLAPSGTYNILIFPTSANGNVAPSRVLNSGAYGLAIALGQGGEMYLSKGPLLGSDRKGPSDAIAIFPPGASGNEAPAGYLGGRGRRSLSAGLRRLALQYPWMPDERARTFSGYAGR
jgi:hypothetical protein